MPEWIAPSLAHFGIDGEDAEPRPLPYVVVATGRPVTTMPELSQVDQAAERTPVDGWRLMARATLCVVDGPAEDEGFLIAPLVPGAFDPAWCDEVARCGGAFVVLLEEAELPERAGLVETAGRPGARGGFVPGVDHT